jgi:hypothetical protein
MKTARVIHCGALALASALSFPSSAVAQAATLMPGSRVRITSPAYELENRVGTLVRLTGDSVTIDFPGKTPRLSLPIDAVSRLDLSMGVRRAAGFWRGAGIGFLVSSAIVGATYLGSRDTCGSGDCAAAFAIVAAGGVVVGSMVGGFIGLAHAPDRWESATLRAPTGAATDRLPATGFRVGLRFATRF